MRTIEKKGNGPRTLLSYRSEKKSYNDYPVKEKNKLRDILVREQGGLCCYCCMKIGHGSKPATIEHWKSQANHSKDQLNYMNLMASCEGNVPERGKRRHKNALHCGASKGKHNIELCPISKLGEKIEDVLYYTDDGRICSVNKKYNKEIDDILNLNYSTLRKGRRGLVIEIEKWLEAEKPDRDAIQREIRKWNDTDAGLEAFSPVATWRLNEHLDEIS